MGQGQGAEPKVDARRFAAFISYSHADKDVASRLQRKLERYRLPKHVALERSNRDSAIGRIFRDREDLAAAPSLSAAIRDAIAQSDALIVVCSPDARDSRWVGEEIALFRKLHPDRPVLAALVRGDHQTSFPDALTADGTEPLAADLRKEGDGESLGFLKIIAGIAGVPLDTLIQRDAQRRVRRVTWITVGALAAMLVMAVMTTLALQARNEAARQRAEAEGLVEYMLTDLREKLKGVGRLDVMNDVNRRAQAYYGDESVNGQLLDARVLHAQGDDERIRGNIEGALSKFRLAEKITGRLHQQYPSNPDAIFGHAQSNYWLGYMAEIKGDMRSALDYKELYAVLVRDYSSLKGRDRSARMELGWSHNTLGAAYLKSANPDKATDHFKRYLAVFSKLVAEKSDDTKARYSLMDANAWMADAKATQGNFAQARRHREEQVRQLDIMIKSDPANVDWKLRRGLALRALARTLKKQGDLNAALMTVDRALAQLNPRNGFDPANAEWRNEHIYAHIDRGFYAQGLRRPDLVRQSTENASMLLAQENQHAVKLSNFPELVTLANQLKGH